LKYQSLMAALFGASCLMSDPAKSSKGPET
jgi:hypothetical protein